VFEGTPATTSQKFDYWFTGVHISHPLGRTIHLFLRYELQYQNTNASLCTGSACGNNVVRNQISLGLAWHGQPIPF
jgi:hypothetical protein